MAEEKKIIVDENWKDEAQHEKEKLAEQEAVEKEKKEDVKKEPAKLPPGDFAALISLLTSQALYAMGMLGVEEGQKKEPDLEMARYNIDMLTTLQEKTKDNLTEQEAAVLESTLSQIRMAFVKVAG